MVNHVICSVQCLKLFLQKYNESERFWRHMSTQRWETWLQQYWYRQVYLTQIYLIDLATRQKRHSGTNFIYPGKYSGLSNNCAVNNTREARMLFYLQHCKALPSLLFALNHPFITSFFKRSSVLSFCLSSCFSLSPLWSSGQSSQ